MSSIVTSLRSRNFHCPQTFPWGHEQHEKPVLSSIWLKEQVWLSSINIYIILFRINYQNVCWPRFVSICQGKISLTFHSQNQHLILRRSYNNQTLPFISFEINLETDLLWSIKTNSKFNLLFFQNKFKKCNQQNAKYF